MAKLKKVAQFNHFDYQGFTGEKLIRATEKKPWADFDTKEIIGTKVIGVIVRDRTDYHAEGVSNLYEKLTFKVKKPISDVHVEIGDYIEGVNVVAKLYGQYQNELSITCDDIKVIPAQPTSQQGGK